MPSHTILDMQLCCASDPWSRSTGKKKLGGRAGYGWRRINMCLQKLCSMPSPAQMLSNLQNPHLLLSQNKQVCKAFWSQATSTTLLQSSYTEHVMSKYLLIMVCVGCIYLLCCHTLLLTSMFCRFSAVKIVICCLQGSLLKLIPAQAQLYPWQLGRSWVV